MKVTANQLEDGKHIYAAILKDNSGYFTVFDPISNLGLLNKIRQYGNISAGNPLKIEFIYDLISEKSMSVIGHGVESLNRGEDVTLDSLCNYCTTSPKMFEHEMIEFNKKHWKE